jgi:arginase
LSEPTAQPGIAAAEAPAVLAPLLAARLSECGVPAAAGPMLRPLATERRKQAAVAKLCGLLASAVADAVRRGCLPCVLGGDHSCAGGTWSGVARTLHAKGAGALGLVWIDAHMDSHTPATSHTGRLHGMPLAWLLGQDDDPLYGLASGVLLPQHVCILGVRVYMLAETRARGLKTVFSEALGIATDGTAAFGVSIDLDVVNPSEAPGVGTPVAGGLGGAELASALAEIGRRGNLAAIELVEYCPRLDANGCSARVAIDLLAAALCGPRQDPQVLAEALERQDP